MEGKMQPKEDISSKMMREYLDQAKKQAIEKYGLPEDAEWTDICRADLGIMIPEWRKKIKGWE
jgi:hypothetical protein